MFDFLKRHFMMIAAVAILAAGGLYYYRQSHGDNVAIQQEEHKIEYTGGEFV
jgi:hypothetical protein